MNTHRLSGSMKVAPRILEFKVLIYRQRDNDRPPVYVAQCLNYDLVAQGETVSDVLNSLQRIIKTQIEVSLAAEIEPFSDFEAAPPEFLAQYEKLSDREEKAFRFAFETSVGPSKPDTVKSPVSSVAALMKLAA